MALCACRKFLDFCTAERALYDFAGRGIDFVPFQLIVEYDYIGLPQTRDK